MKKTKMLALVLAAAVMLMGAGYAYWTEDLTINNTVTTGKLDFTFQNAAMVSVDDFMDYDPAFVSFCKVNTADNNVVDIALMDMYPGATASVKFDLKNTGTMAAKVKNFACGTFDGGDSFQISSFKVGGSDIITAPVSLANLQTVLATKKITLEPNESKTFEITFQIDPLADNDDVAESSSYEFSISADGLQYNDYIN